MASDFAIRLAAHHVKHGGVIIYPTETVYGLGCDPLNKAAVNFVNALKNRDSTKGLILLAGTVDQLYPFIDQDKKLDLAKLQPSEQPTSWILPANAGLPSWLTAKDHTIAVRISSHPVVKQLCHILGHPLVSSSANPSGAKPAMTILQLQKYFHDMVHSIIVSDNTMSGRPSTVKRLNDNVALRE